MPSRPPLHPAPARHGRLLAALMLVCSLLVGSLLAGSLLGCAGSTEFVTVRDASRNPFASSIETLPGVGMKPSDRTTQILRRYNLEGSHRQDTDAAAAYIAQNATPATRHEHQFAIAELEFLAAKRAESSAPERAISHYGTSLLSAYDFLFNQPNGVACSPYDPQFRGACDLYNKSLEGMLRLVQRSGEIHPGQRRTIQTAEHLCSFDIVLHSDGWHEEDVGALKFVSDFQVAGLRNHYRTYGLGVPLIAVRNEEHNSGPAEDYYPGGLSFPLTAFLRIEHPPADATGAAPASPRFKLELRDPTESQQLQVAGQRPPLESDLSTPLAYFLNQPELRGQTLSTAGLLAPDRVRALQGLYMLEPYDPNKMPVLMVHGLWSSPVTWMEMFNDLRSDPRICEKYQFWFYLYPTGQPFWVSAAQLRQELATVRHRIDPQHSSAALDQMVLVGHSMGGLVSKMQSVESSGDFWRINSERPFDELAAERELRVPLAQANFFRPNESVRRVITIGTPHRGSRFANQFTRWAARKLIRPPAMFASGRSSLWEQNPDFFRPNSAFSIRTSIDSLAPESPLLPVLLAAKPAPWVEYHNIVGRVEREGWHGYFSEDGDGVVSLASAKLDGAPQVVSQEVVQADHISVHRHPQSIYAVRQILLQQLEELENLPYGGAVPEPAGPIQLVERPPPAGTPSPARPLPKLTR